MKVRLKFFSILRQHFNTEGKEIEVDRPKSVREIFLELFDNPALAGRFLPCVRFALNWDYVSPEAFVKDGDELALIPPVSGG